MTYLLYAVFGLFFFGSMPALAGKCEQADKLFAVIKTLDEYRIEYKEKVVLRLSFGELNDLYGGKEPSVSCSGDISTPDFFVIVVGWQRDLLVAFGISRDMDSRPVRLTKLSWSPHKGSIEFQSVSDKPNEIIVRYDPYITRICWDIDGTQRWSFSTNPHGPVAGPCDSPIAPFGSDQLLLSIN